MGEGIPGVKFKNKHVSHNKSEEKETFQKARVDSLKKSMEKLSVMTKTKTSSYLHTCNYWIIKMNFWKEMLISVYS
jgi:hypothetical protein